MVRTDERRELREESGIRGHCIRCIVRSVWIYPLIPNANSPVRDVNHIVACGFELAIEEELASPFRQRASGLCEMAGFGSNVLFMFHISTECPSHVRANEDSTKTKVRPFISKESRSLLDGVCITHTEASWHVRDGQAFNCETAIHRLAANNNPRIRLAPVYSRSAASTGVEFRNFRQ